MKLDFIPLDKLCVSKANMRHGRKPPDVSDILPTVRARGVLTPLIVRPVERSPGQAIAEAARAGEAAPAFEILAGSRRFHAARLVAAERREGEAEADPAGDRLPCAVLDAGDDAAAIEASLIENLARLDPDEVARWETFVRLVREGRSPEDIAATFGLPELAVKRVLALGNLLPRIRKLYREEQIDRATVRQLTLASKAQQKAWLALCDDPQGYAPRGHQLKAWLLGGQSVSASHALFDVEASGLATVADLFGEERYFADADAFWRLQNAAIAERRQTYLDDGWADAVIVPPGEYFQTWDHARASRRKGGRVYLDVRESGEVIVHEGYVTRKEARRLESGEPLAPQAKPTRPEVSGPLQVYCDLHRHAAARAALTDHPGLALRLMVAHAICGSPLWSVRAEPQSARQDAVRESLETSVGEAAFDLKRRAVLDVLGFSPEEATVTGGNGDPYGLVGMFLRLIELPDEAVMAVVAVAMGETLAAGSAAVEAVGGAVGLAMAHWWQADEAFFELLRDREVLTAIVAEVAGETVAEANAKETGKTLKTIIRDHLAGANGRPKVDGWVPKWMAFPPAAYTARGGVGTVAAHALVEAYREDTRTAAQAEAERHADPDAPPWDEAEAPPQAGTPVADADADAASEDGGERGGEAPAVAPDEAERIAA
jgi:ParB family chromosome partitioning protein